MVFVTLFTKGPTKVQLRKTHDSVLEGFSKAITWKFTIVFFLKTL